MTQDSNAGERNEDDMTPFEQEPAREPTAEEIAAAKVAQEIADGHRYMPQEMRDARDAKPERPKKPEKSLKAMTPNAGERIAKVLARAGLASRREIERLIGLGKIAVNGRILETPAVLVNSSDVITVDGQEIGKAEPTRLWRYHKPVGLVTTERDPEGRPTVFDKLPSDLPRVLKVGRLDLNSEGLLLLTNDGELARALELPSSGWVRRYRARALGHTTQARLDSLKDGTTVEGVIYGPIEATLDKMQEKADGRANVWITVAITEGKNREVRKVLESIGLKVNRLIRLAYGPFQLGNLEPGEVEEVGPRVIRELLADVVPLKNLPVEGASQTAARPASRFTRDKSDTRGAPEGRRGGGDRFEKPKFGDKPRFGDKPSFGDKPRFSDKPRKDFAEKREYKERDFDARPRFEGDGEARDRKPTSDRDFVARPRYDADRPRDDRPKRAYGDKPAFSKPYASRDGAAAGERKPYGDKPGFKKPYAPRDGAASGERKPYGDKPGFKKPYTPRDIPAGEAGAYERAKREFGGDRPRDDRPREDRPRDDRPKREYGDRPQAARSSEGRPSFNKPYAARAEGSDRPRRDYGDRPQGGASEGRPAFKKPYAARAEGSDRPRRDYGDRPQGGASEGRPAFKKPYAARAEGSDRPRRDYGDRPQGDRPQGDSRPPFKKSYAPRDGAGGGERKSYGDKPGGGYKRDGDASRGPKREYAPREGGERKSYGDRSRSDGPRSDGPRSYGQGAGDSGPSGGGYKGKPSGARPSGGKPPFKPRRD